MKTKPPYETYLLIVLFVFLSIGAFYGSISLLVEPSGSLLGMQVVEYRNFPFRDFFFPAIILLLLFGLVPLLLISPLIKQPDINWVKSLNIYRKRHWAWTYSLYIGFALVIWINFQIWMMGYSSNLQIIYSFYGLAIIVVCLLPKQMRHFSKHHKHSHHHNDYNTSTDNE